MSKAFYHNKWLSMKRWQAFIVNAVAWETPEFGSKIYATPTYVGREYRDHRGKIVREIDTGRIIFRRED